MKRAYECRRSAASVNAFRESTTPADRLRAQRPDHVWAVDYQFDVTATGRRIKLLHVVNEFTCDQRGPLILVRGDSDG